MLDSRGAAHEQHQDESGSWRTELREAEKKSWVQERKRNMFQSEKSSTEGENTFNESDMNKNIYRKLK